MSRRYYNSERVQTNRVKPIEDYSDQIRTAGEQLDNWLSRFDSNLIDQIGDAPKFVQYVASISQERRSDAFRMFALYHKASFFVYGPWIPVLAKRSEEESHRTSPPSIEASELQKRCIEKAVGSAMAVIRVISHFEFAADKCHLDARQDLFRLLPISLCFLLSLVVLGNQAGRERVTPYLGMFGATMGLIALGSPGSDLVGQYFRLMSSEGFV